MVQSNMEIWEVSQKENSGMRGKSEGPIVLREKKLFCSYVYTYMRHDEWGKWDHNCRRVRWDIENKICAVKSIGGGHMHSAYIREVLPTWNELKARFWLSTWMPGLLLKDQIGLCTWFSKLFMQYEISRKTNNLHS